jgi:hypothetical protein
MIDFTIFFSILQPFCHIWKCDLHFCCKCAMLCYIILLVQVAKLLLAGCFLKLQVRIATQICAFIEIYLQLCYEQYLFYDGGFKVISASRVFDDTINLPIFRVLAFDLLGRRHEDTIRFDRRKHDIFFCRINVSAGRNRRGGVLYLSVVVDTLISGRWGHDKWAFYRVFMSRRNEDMKW